MFTRITRQMAAPVGRYIDQVRFRETHVDKISRNFSIARNPPAWRACWRACVACACVRVCVSDIRRTVSARGERNSGPRARLPRQSRRRVNPPPSPMTSLANYTSVIAQSVVENFAGFMIAAVKCVVLWVRPAYGPSTAATTRYIAIRSEHSFLFSLSLRPSLVPLSFSPSIIVSDHRHDHQRRSHQSHAKLRRGISWPSLSRVMLFIVMSSMSAVSPKLVVPTARRHVASRDTSHLPLRRTFMILFVFTRKLLSIGHSWDVRMRHFHKLFLSQDVFLSIATYAGQKNTFCHSMRSLSLRDKTSVSCQLVIYSMHKSFDILFREINISYRTWS